MSEKKSPTIIFTAPLLALAAEFRKDADRERERGRGADAALYAHFAQRIDEAIEAGASNTWVKVADAAALLQKDPETIRVRCRKHLEGRGLAKKLGGQWLVAREAIAA